MNLKKTDKHYFTWKTLYNGTGGQACQIMRCCQSRFNSNPKSKNMCEKALSLVTLERFCEVHLIFNLM